MLHFCFSEKSFAAGNALRLKKSEHQPGRNFEAEPILSIFIMNCRGTLVREDAPQLFPRKLLGEIHFRGTLPAFRLNARTSRNLEEKFSKLLNAHDAGRKKQILIDKF